MQPETAQCPKCGKQTKTRKRRDPFGRSRVVANCCNVRIVDPEPAAKK